MVRDEVLAAFEAGIKLGALYHQWVGTPIAPDTAPTLEKAIEQAVALQPFVEHIRVSLDTARMAKNIFGYSELAGTMFDVVVTTRVGSASCRASLRCEDDYPLMKILECR